MSESVSEFTAASAFAILAAVFFALDSRKCHREHYRQKYGYRASSIWILPALLFAVIAMALFRLWAHR